MTAPTLADEIAALRRLLARLEIDSSQQGRIDAACVRAALARLGAMQLEHVFLRCTGDCKGHPFQCYGHPLHCPCFPSSPEPQEGER